MKKSFILACLAAATALAPAHSAKAENLRLRWETLSQVQFSNCYALAPNNGTPRALYEDCQRIHWGAEALPDPTYPHFRLDNTPLVPTTVPGAFQRVTKEYPPPMNGFGYFARNSFAANIPRSFVTYGTKSLEVRFEYGPALWNLSNSYDVVYIDTPNDRIPIMGMTKGRRFYGGASGYDGDGAPVLLLDADFTDVRDAQCTPFFLGPDPACVGYMRTARPPQDAVVHEYDGVTVRVPVSADRLNPDFKKYIDAFRGALGEARANLIRNAGTISDLERKLGSLDGLGRDVDNLLDEGFDNVTPARMEELLSRYPEIPNEVRERAVELIKDLKRTVAELKAELERLQAEFSARADDTLNLVYANLGDSGVAVDDSGTYVLVTSPNDVAEVRVPSVEGVPFDPSNDAYGSYADTTIADLRGFMSGSVVQERRAFLRRVQAWQARQAFFQQVVAGVGTSRAEYNAFLNARNRVVDFLKNYLDAQGWFLDNPVPQATRRMVEGVLFQVAGPPAGLLREAMNIWSGGQLTPDEQLLNDTVEALGTGLQQLVLLGQVTDSTVEIIRGVVADVGFAAGRVAIGFVPGVGTALDICEARTGHEFCRESGRQLSDTERVLAGIGAVPGAAQFWTGVALASRATGSTAKVLTTLAGLGHLGDLARAEQKVLFRRLGAVARHIDDVPGKEIRRLADVFGDALVVRMGAQLKGAGLRELETMEFMLSYLNARVQTAARTRGAAVKALPAFKGKSATSIRSSMQAAGFKQVSVTPVQEVWVHADGSVVRMGQRTGSRPFPHVKKEISYGTGWEDADIACKVTDSGGVPVAQGTKEAGDGMLKWYRRRVGVTPDPDPADDTSALKLLLDWWADATHPPFVP